MKLAPRETVVHAENFERMVKWYHEVLGLRIAKQFTEDFHYCNLENDEGVRIGISSAKEMGVVPQERKHNTVVLQFEVSDVKAFLEHLTAHGAKTTFGPSHSEKDDFWYGGAEDIEGNPIWVVDENCP